MSGLIANIEERAQQNRDFRRVVYTGQHLQLVLMALPPGEEIGEEVHPEVDQFLQLEEGSGEVWVDGHVTPVRSDTAIIVPAGAVHNVKNTGDRPLKLYSLYAPPEHPHGTVHATRAEAEAAETGYAEQVKE